MSMWVRREEQELERTEMTSMIDIIFQLMIFFLVTTSVLPATKSAPQVEGNLVLGTPKQGASEVNAVIQLQRNPTTGKLEYYILQGNDNSAEFYNTIERVRSIVDSPLLEGIGKRYQVWHDFDSMRSLMVKLADMEPRVLIRADRKTHYGEVVKISSFLQSVGINKYGWVGGSLRDLQAKIIKTQPRVGRI